jgi:hypothetical protein
MDTKGHGFTDSSVVLVKKQLQGGVWTTSGERNEAVKKRVFFRLFVFGRCVACCAEESNNIYQIYLASLTTGNVGYSLLQSGQYGHLPRSND